MERFLFRFGLLWVWILATSTTTTQGQTLDLHCSNDTLIQRQLISQLSVTSTKQGNNIGQVPGTELLTATPALQQLFGGSWTPNFTAANWGTTIVLTPSEVF